MQVFEFQNCKYSTATEVMSEISKAGVMQSATFWRRIKSGEIPSVLISRTRLVPLEWFEKQVEKI